MRLISMSHYFSHEPELWRSTPVVVHSDDVRFIAAANIAAGWLLDILEPFFWAALIVMLALAEISSPG